MREWVEKFPVLWVLLHRTKAEVQNVEIRNVPQGIQRPRGLKQPPVISVLVLAPVEQFHRWRPGVADVG